jgi:hypothetical protein
MDKPYLGQYMDVDHKLERISVGNNRHWMPKRIETKSVMLIGLRTLANGIVTGGTADDGPPILVPTVHFQAMLVVEELHRKPFYVLHPKDIYHEAEQ